MAAANSPRVQCGALCGRDFNSTETLPIRRDPCSATSASCRALLIRARHQLGLNWLQRASIAVTCTKCQAVIYLSSAKIRRSRAKSQKKAVGKADRATAELNRFCRSGAAVVATEQPASTAPRSVSGQMQNGSRIKSGVYGERETKSLLNVSAIA